MRPGSRSAASSCARPISAGPLSEEFLHLRSTRLVNESRSFPGVGTTPQRSRGRESTTAARPGPPQDMPLRNLRQRPSHDRRACLRHIVRICSRPRDFGRSDRSRTRSRRSETRRPGQRGAIERMRQMLALPGGRARLVREHAAHRRRLCGICGDRRPAVPQTAVGNQRRRMARSPSRLRSACTA